MNVFRNRFGTNLCYLELPCDLITVDVLNELAQVVLIMIIKITIIICLKTCHCPHCCLPSSIEQMLSPNNRNPNITDIHPKPEVPESDSPAA